MYNNIDEQEQDIRMRMPEMGIGQLEELLRSYKIYNCLVTDIKTGERVWQYAESIELVEEELRIRRGH